MPKGIPTQPVAIKNAEMRVTIEAAIPIELDDDFDSANDCIEEALDAFLHYGKARVVSKAIYGVPARQNGKTPKVKNV